MEPGVYRICAAAGRKRGLVGLDWWDWTGGTGETPALFSGVDGSSPSEMESGFTAGSANRFCPRTAARYFPATLYFLFISFLTPFQPNM